MPLPRTPPPEPAKPVAEKTTPIKITESGRFKRGNNCDFDNPESPKINKMVLTKKDIEDIVGSATDNVLKEVTEVNNLLTPALKRVEVLEEQVDKLERIIDKIGRQKNVVIFGVPECESEKKDRSGSEIRNKLSEIWRKLKLEELQVDDAFRLGKAGLKRPIMVKFVKISDKNKVMKQKKELGPEKIFINQDQSKEDLAREKKLRDKLKEFKQANKYITGRIVKGNLLLYSRGKFLNKMTYSALETELNSTEMEN